MIRQEDEERLPPMIANEDITERQRLEDLKHFRKYLVDTGAVKCLVKMYKKAAQEEMRLDNPKLVTQFLAGYTDGNPDAEEIKTLARENATLEEYNSVMEQQVSDLEAEVARQLRLRLARKLWKHLMLSKNEEQVDISLDELYGRFCGQEVEKSTNEILVNLLRPESYMGEEVKSTRLSKDGFCAIVADAGLSDAMLAWLEEQLLARFEDCEPGHGAYQQELAKAIQDSGLLPHDTFLLSDAVKLDQRLVDFLEAAVAGPPAPVEREEVAAEEELDGDQS